MSSIVIRTKFQKTKDMKKSVSKTLNYIGNKKKADPMSIDDSDMITDYAVYSKSGYDLVEGNEQFVWSSYGDVNRKNELKKLDSYKENGVLWSVVISFPPEFAINNGLITKKDYYDLTMNVIPSLLTDANFNLNNVVWYCSLHRDTNNPHLHINFYEKALTKSDPKIPYHSIHKLKSNIANYLIDNEKFYKLRDAEFKKITGDVTLKDLNRIKEERLFNDKFRKELNKKLLDLYKVLPESGRLQYNSKNSYKYKSELQSVINFILLNDNIKYSFNNYINILKKYQDDLVYIYGNTNENNNCKYVNEQLDKLYSKIGNDILKNFKIYSSQNKVESELEFMKKNIDKFNFKTTAKKDVDKIASELNNLCLMIGLNESQRIKIISNWIKKSNLNLNVNEVVSNIKNIESGMSLNDYYNLMKKLGYSSNRYFKIKSKEFYRDLNYKIFMSRAMKHLKEQLEYEEERLIDNLDVELGNY